MYVGRSLELLGEYSPVETELFGCILSPGHTVIEVGVNMGAHTVPLASFVAPAGRVHAFEPQQPMFQHMCANLALNGHLNPRAWNCAVSDEPGTLYIPPTNYQWGNNFVVSR